MLRPNFLFAVAVALAAVHLRAVLQEQPGAGSARQDCAVRADGGDLLSVVAVCRTAIPQRYAGADAPRGIPHRRPQHSSSAGWQRGWNCREPDAVGCRPRRAAAGILQRLQYPPLYRVRSCFSPVGDVLGDACLGLASGKTNVLLWGDSLAAHYFHGLRKTTDPEAVNMMQATQAACMPTFNAAAQGIAACRSFATQMDAFFRDRNPDLVILSADWLEYARPPRFDGMIADVRQTISQLNGLGAAVVLLGPAVQFRTRLPSMLLRAHLRNVDADPSDFVLPDIFSLDQKMKAALPAHARFSYISVVDAICPTRQCPLTIDGGIPLAWDHAHLTAEGSVYVMERLVPMLHLDR